MPESYDVVVAGAGAAGLTAAIQAARAGASVLLVEKTGMPGGTTTMAHVNYPGLFYAWGRPVVAGIGWELVLAAVREAGGALPDFSRPPERPNQYHVRVNVALFAALADRALRESGADVLFHTMLAGAARAGALWQLSLCTLEGLRPVRCKVLVDCTAEACAVRLAGLGVEKHQPMQPGTLVFTVGGYDRDSLDVEAILKAFGEAVARGVMKETDFGWGGKLRSFLRSGGGNCNHVCGIDSSTSEGKTRAEMAGRELLLRIFRFLQAQKGLENVAITSVAPECGIRETVTLRGRQSITLEDYVGGRVWPDAVCYSYYPIDLHTTEGTGYDLRPLPEGVVATIPRGALLPQGGEFLIAAGRHIAGDRLAHSAYRTQATCMATGQAAGAMAALAARAGVEPGDLDMPEVRALLRRHGALVPG